jgi:hypothetical protein
MKIIDLIAELQRFGPDARVAVEVEPFYGPDADPVLLDVERLIPESEDRFEAKIILAR